MSLCNEFYRVDGLQFIPGPNDLCEQVRGWWRGGSGGYEHKFVAQIIAKQNLDHRNYICLDLRDCSQKHLDWVKFRTLLAEFHNQRNSLKTRPVIVFGFSPDVEKWLLQYKAPYLETISLRS